ncbi:MAG: hypothetical protein ABIO55_13435 [Ginsengibacter sp.]
MKNIVFLIILSFVVLKGAAQEDKKQNLGTFIGIPKGINLTDLANWKALNMDANTVWGVHNNIKGNAFYNEKWNKAYILLQDKRIEKDVFMNFNIYTNEIYYLFDSLVLVLNPAIKVSEFGINDPKSDSGNVTVFRCGYPAIDNNTTKTFYKVLANSKIELLLHYNKTIIEATDPTGVPEKKFINSESWYIYNTGENKIIPIKKNKNSLIAALPQYSKTIEAVIREKKLKLKREIDWVILLNELNKPV